MHIQDDKRVELDEPINNLVIVKYRQPLDYIDAFTTNKIIAIVIS